MSINNLMNQGRTALSVNQMALSTTSHNVANANTKGYSRQRVELAANSPMGLGRHQIGTGVKLEAVQRTHSEFVNRRLEEESTNLGRFEGGAEVMGQLEMIFANDGDSGLSKTVSQFFNDLRTLSTQPESQPLRAAVRESANAVTSRFRSLSQGLASVVSDLDRRVEGSVDQLNFITGKIQQLNQRIVEVELKGSGATANDERDARDMAIQELAKIVPVQVTQVENGLVNISSSRIGVLVNGADRVELMAERSPDGVNPGSVRVFTADSNGRRVKDVTDSLESGQLGSYIHIRDRVTPDYRDRVDTLASRLATNVNDIHRSAYSADGKQGVSFFRDTGEGHTAATLELSEAVTSDLGAIATGFQALAPGDNRALLQMADLQDAKLFDGGKANFVDFTASIVGQVGAEVKSMNDSFEVQRGLMDQLGNMREQVAGVSLDEEALNMIKFQKAFDASAKMIQTADQMLDTVLNLKRF